ncbi:MAG: ankyrin repeat domain-containing protein [Candidatus Margulisbacteria bacterium]|nr:ankyrin repeat domain-containing protein [Candidatus Margulisiibacteriota bacterium]
MQKNKIIGCIAAIKPSEFLLGKFELLKTGRNIFAARDTWETLNELLRLKAGQGGLRKLFGSIKIKNPDLSLEFLTPDKKPDIDTTSEQTKTISKAKVSIYSCLTNLNEKNIDIVATVLSRDFHILGFEKHRSPARKDYLSFDLFKIVNNYNPDISGTHLWDIISQGADVNTRNENLRTPLFNAVACSAGTEALRILISVDDINVNTRDAFGNTALIMAVIMNKTEYVAELLRAPDIDISIENKDGKTALDIAREKDQHSIINLLTGFKPNKAGTTEPMVMPETTTVKERDIERNSELLETIMSYDYVSGGELKLKNLIARKTGLNYRNQLNRTPLIISVMENKVPVVKMLLRNDALDLNVQDYFGNTALHMAVAMNKPDIVRMLLSEPGLDLSLKNNSGKTALDIATEKNKNIMQEIIKYGQSAAS